MKKLNKEGLARKEAGLLCLVSTMILNIGLDVWSPQLIEVGSAGVDAFC